MCECVYLKKVIGLFDEHIHFERTKYNGDTINKIKYKILKLFFQNYCLEYETLRTKHNIFSEFCLKHKKKTKKWIGLVDNLYVNRQ